VIKEGIEGHPVNWYSEVFDLLFPGLDHEAARMVWGLANASFQTMRAASWSRPGKRRSKTSEYQFTGWNEE
jgi:hypothetical protein